MSIHAWPQLLRWQYSLMMQGDVDMLKNCAAASWDSRQEKVWLIVITPDQTLQCESWFQTSSELSPHLRWKLAMFVTPWGILVTRKFTDDDGACICTIEDITRLVTTSMRNALKEFGLNGRRRLLGDKTASWQGYETTYCWGPKLTNREGCLMR